MQKLLIAECNEILSDALSDALQDRFAVCTCRTGKQALALLRQERPDLVLMEVMLPELDGLTLLETAAAEQIPLKVLVATTMATDYLVQSAARLGICYIMRKPCNFQALITRICDLAQSGTQGPQRPDPRILLEKLLRCHHLSPKHNGYEYMTEAVFLMLQNPDMSTTKELYPAVAKKFGCKSRHVERSIRSALDAAWARSSADVWQTYFPGAEKRPSNTVFISRMAQLLRQQGA